MDVLTTLLRRITNALGNDGAVRNAGALRRQRRHEAWRVATLERACARADTTSARRTARIAS